MKGLELSRRYFQELAIPVIEKANPKFMEIIAAGLVGEGSQCFGFDDEISRDHDWGPGFCIWLRDGDMEQSAELEQIYCNLPKEFLGFRQGFADERSGKRLGVFRIGDFYCRFTGLERAPQNSREWLSIPEHLLAVATYGQVFHDGPGEFSHIRRQLLDFYPEDVRLRKMAEGCFNAGQGGQYNYPRCIKRGELVAAQFAVNQFIEGVIALTYLLNKRYKPFYKWMHRGLTELPLFGPQLHSELNELLCGRQDSLCDPQMERVMVIEKIAQQLIGILRERGLSDSPSDFLVDHAPVLHSRIQNLII